MLSAMKKQRSKQRALPRDRAPRSPFIMATTDDVRQALEQLDLDAGWDHICRSVVPLLPRRAPSPIRAGAPLQSLLGPGILVSFGIDFGPAFANVTRDLAGRCGVSDGDIVAAALGNVRALATELPPKVVTTVDLDDGETVRVLRSGAGWASSLLLMPDLLPRFFGPGPHLIGAPCRDIILAFAAGTSLDLVFDVVGSLAWADPVGLVPSCYRHLDGALEPVAAPPGLAVLPELEPPARPRFVS